jgi:hypothetical protein
MAIRANEASAREIRQVLQRLPITGGGTASAGGSVRQTMTTSESVTMSEYTSTIVVGPYVLNGRVYLNGVLAII